MRNKKLFALTAQVALDTQHSVIVVGALLPTKKDAKQTRKLAVKCGIFQLSGEIMEIEPSDWTVTIHNPEIPNTYPLPLAKGSRFHAEAEHCANLFKQILPSHFVVDVVKFDETEAYKTLEQGEQIAQQLQQEAETKAQNKGAFYA